MKIREKKATQYPSEIAKLKKLVRAGDYTAAFNIAVTYRMAGKLRLAFKWWQRSASLGDGSAFLELGYCYQYGIGVRKNIRNACAAYRKAIRFKRYVGIAPYEWEEAYYHLAIAHLDMNKNRPKVSAARLLRKAAADGDYPQADDLLQQIKSGKVHSICRCRRFLYRRSGGKAQCALHAGKQT